MGFDRDRFFAAFRERFGPLTQSQVDGLNFLLGRAEEDAENWQNRSQLAYGLATVTWETARHFTPIAEFGRPDYFDKYEPGTPIGEQLGNTAPGDGFRYRGRGYAQITGRANYERIGRLLALDLAGDPDRALDAGIAYSILARGMRHGWFTGRKLPDYVPSDREARFAAARAVINGSDHADDIAAIAMKMRSVLDAAVLLAA